MTDYQTLGQALEQEARDNFLTGLSSSVLSPLAQSAVTYSQQPGADLSESLLIGGVLGALSGGARGYGNRLGTEQASLANQVLRGVTNERPTGLRSSLFNRAKSYRDLLAADILAKRGEKVFDKKLDITASDLLNESKSERALGNIVREELEKERAADLISRGLTADPKDAGGEVRLGPTPTEPMGSPAGMLTRRGKEQYSRAQRKVDITSDLAKEFKKDVAIYRKQESGFRALMQAMDDPAGTSDFELVRRAAQAVEPGLAVRRDDQESIEGAASLFGQYGAAITNALSGGSKLEDDVRDGIARIAARGLAASQPDYNTLRESFIRRATGAEIDPENIAIYGEAIAPEEMFPDYDFSNPNVVGEQEAAAFITDPNSIPRGMKLQSNGAGQFRLVPQ